MYLPLGSSPCDDKLINNSLQFYSNRQSTFLQNDGFHVTCMTSLCLDGGEDKEVSNNPCKGNASWLCFCWTVCTTLFYCCFSRVTTFGSHCFVVAKMCTTCMTYITVYQVFNFHLTLTWSHQCFPNMCTTNFSKCFQFNI